MTEILRRVTWIGSSRDDVAEMPKPVRGSFGTRLQDVQRGRMPAQTTALTQFGPGVFEMRENHQGNAFRMMYVLKLKKAIYVLHVFMKKSKSGIGLPKTDANLIAVRLKRAKEMDAED